MLEQEFIGYNKNMSLEQLEKAPNNKERAVALLRGEIAPKNRFENQIVLAFRVYKMNNPELDFDLDSIYLHDDIFMSWSNGKLDNSEKTWSEIYKEIESDVEFLNHPRLKGDTTKIELDDVIYFGQYKKLPKD